jgi:hypothetical protein
VTNQELLDQAVCLNSLLARSGKVVPPLAGLRVTRFFCGTTRQLLGP